MTTELSPERILSADISLRNLNDEDELLEQQIQEAAKGISFSMTLTLPQQLLMQRFADSTGVTWQQYLRHQIEQKILGTTALVGGPLITGPSFAGNVKVRAPHR